MKKREALFATTAVVLMGSFGVTTVYLIGSGQRRADRAAYLSFEQAVLAPIRETRRVAQEMRAQVAELRGPARPQGLSSGVTQAWRSDLAKARLDVLGLDEPAFLRGVEARWVSALDRYVQVSQLLAQGDLQRSEQALSRADEFLADAARTMQFHRRRLRLGPTSRLPDPAASEES